jgi:hypothetical protein
LAEFKLQAAQRMYPILYICTPSIDTKQYYGKEENLLQQCATAWPSRKMLKIYKYEKIESILLADTDQFMAVC